MFKNVRYGLTGTGPRPTDQDGFEFIGVSVEYNAGSDGSELLRIELGVPQVAAQDRTYQAGEFSKDLSAGRIRIDAPLGRPGQPESGVAITLFLPQVPPSLVDAHDHTAATGVAVFMSAPPDGEVESSLPYPSKETSHSRDSPTPGRSPPTSAPSSTAGPSRRAADCS